jgi:hypothetical protein
MAYAISCFFVKLSLGSGYLHILKFRHLDSRWERLVCYAFILVSCAVNLELFFYLLIVATERVFTPNQTGVKIGGVISTYLQSATNVVIDWILVLLPIPSILEAILDRKTRFSIIGILLLGAR